MKRSTTRKLRAEVDELKRRLERANEDCRLIAQQRDESAANAGEYRAALTNVLAAFAVIFDGAQQAFTDADAAADKRARSRYRDQCAMTPDSGK